MSQSDSNTRLTLTRRRRLPVMSMDLADGSDSLPGSPLLFSQSVAAPPTAAQLRWVPDLRRCLEARIAALGRRQRRMARLSESYGGVGSTSIGLRVRLDTARSLCHAID